jgi:hypothetical protein
MVCDNKDQRSGSRAEPETERRFNETVRNLLNTPPKPHKHVARMALAPNGASTAVICLDLGVPRSCEAQIVCRADLRELWGTRMSTRIRCA